MKARFLCLAASLPAALAVAAALAASAEPTTAAAFDASGTRAPPSAYREWIYLSSGIDMAYRERAGAADHSMFDNVFAEPSAYRAFLATGTWPDGAMLVMEVRGAASEGSINRAGKFQTGERMGLELHVKDTRRYGGWAFFAFDGDAPAAPIPQAADCYACHREHGAVDTTFVQFYPTLLDV
ncbi:MAG TPA: cytochrome P460 family protein, partial [Dokdonella sp.]